MPIATLIGRVAIACAVATLCAPIVAANPLFESDETLTVVLSAPFDDINRERTLIDRPEHPGQLEYSDADGKRTVLDVKVRARGNFRRRTCRLPPLRLNFRKRQVENTLFAGQDKLKLVAPCEINSRYEGLIVSEYLIYRAYSELTDYGFRVRGVDVAYAQGSRQEAARRTFGFLIEDSRDLAQRMEKTLADWESAAFSKLDPAHLARLEVFQHMIGGHDWSVLEGPDGERCCHNMRLLIDEGAERGAIPVPYDFDLTGMVDAPYAEPPVAVPVRRVRQRYFRGLCRDPSEWEPTFALFQSRRDAIYALYRDHPLLPKRTRRKSIKYLDEFYQEIDEPARRARLVASRCKS